MSKYIHFVNSVSCHIEYTSILSISHEDAKNGVIWYSSRYMIIHSVGKYAGLASTSSLLLEVYLVPRTLLLVVQASAD